MNLKQKLLGGTKVAGSMMRLVRNPALTRIAQNSGLDFILLDCEHSNYNFETLHDMFLMADAIGLGGFVRVPQGSKDYISRVLDAGAIGVMVPMIETVEQAKTLVKYSKYLPIGERGFGAPNAHVAYKSGKHAEVMQQQNDRVIAIAQIETKLAVENVEAIAAVEGIDALLVGPNDLSLSLGIPGDLMNPIELEAITKVAAACKKNSKAFGLHSGKELLEKFAADLTLVMCASDADMLANGFAGIRKMVDDFK